MSAVIHSNPNLYVITGGPGTGKTTVLRELERRGFAVEEEVARRIIREQMESGGNALPWGDTGFTPISCCADRLSRFSI